MDVKTQLEILRTIDPESRYLYPDVRLPEALEVYEAIEERDRTYNTWNGQKRNLIWYSDMCLYNCPVRKAIGWALQDKLGKWWSGKLWYAGGEIETAIYNRLDLVVTLPEDEFPDCHDFQTQIERQIGTWEEGICYPVLVNEGLEVFGHGDLKPGFEKALRALHAFEFEEEWGTGSFIMTMRAINQARRRTRAKRKEK